MTQPPIEILSQAKELIRAGKKEEARNMLNKFLQQNPHSEHGWWLMSFAAAHPDQQIQCLKKILQINPDREKVKVKLEELAGKQVVGHAGAQASSEPNAPQLPSKSKKKTPWRWIIPLLVGGFVIVSLVFYFKYQKDPSSPAPNQAQEITPLGSPTFQSAGLPPTWTSGAPTQTQIPLPTSTEMPAPTGSPTPDPNATRTPVPEPWIGTRAGKYPPDFALKDVVTGEVISIRDFAGQPVLIAFFATWCPYCRADLPLVQEIYEEYESQGFVVLGVGVKESETTARNFGSRYALTFPITADASSAVADDYLISGYPYYYFISKTGKIGYVNPGTIKMDNLIIYLNKQ